MLKFYDTIPDMECLQGDTLPTFEITLNEDAPAGTLYLVVTKNSDPTRIIIQKEGTAADEGFTVNLDGSDTVRLGEGTYWLDFFLISSGKCYKKLRGRLCVKSAASPQEV